MQCEEAHSSNLRNTSFTAYLRLHSVIVHDSMAKDARKHQRHAVSLACPFPRCHLAMRLRVNLPQHHLAYSSCPLPAIPTERTLPHGNNCALLALHVFPRRTERAMRHEQTCVHVPDLKLQTGSSAVSPTKVEPVSKAPSSSSGTRSKDGPWQVS